MQNRGVWAPLWPLVSPGPGERQLEDTESGASGLPRQQVPVPSQAAPLRLGLRAGPLEGGDGKGGPVRDCWGSQHASLLTSGEGWGQGQPRSAPSSHRLHPSPGAFSTSDEEGPSEESHIPEGLHQASGLPMLVKEASGAGDGAWGAPGGPWGFSMRPHPRGWASKRRRGSGAGRGRSQPARVFRGFQVPTGRGLPCEMFTAGQVGWPAPPLGQVSSGTQRRCASDLGCAVQVRQLSRPSRAANCARRCL